MTTKAMRKIRMVTTAANQAGELSCPAGKPTKYPTKPRSSRTSPQVYASETEKSFPFKQLSSLRPDGVSKRRYIIYTDFTIVK